MKINIVIIAIISLLSGCIKDGSYLGGLVSVERLDKQQTSKSNKRINNMSAQANAQGFCSYGCKSIEPNPMASFEFAINDIGVDTAYTRIKREFNFKTRNELISEKPFLESLLSSSLDFRYQSIPGVSYLMRGYKEHNYSREETPNTIQIEISKDGKHRVFLKVSFYSGNTRSIRGYKKSLKSRIIKAVKG
ncbi:hypothetical protein SPONN_829 [uncultured Candidatus Thioglobus sp.]|nr:hypothetical protein SPONN_829 [uncultured Candidatus Thioglobus sp.]